MPCTSVGLLDHFIYRLAHGSRLSREPHFIWPDAWDCSTCQAPPICHRHEPSACQAPGLPATLPHALRYPSPSASTECRAAWPSWPAPTPTQTRPQPGSKTSTTRRPCESCCAPPVPSLGTFPLGRLCLHRG